MLDFHIVVRPRQTQTGRTFEGPFAIVVELTNKLLEIYLCAIFLETFR